MEIFIIPLSVLIFILEYSSYKNKFSDVHYITVVALLLQIVHLLPETNFCDPI